MILKLGKLIFIIALVATLWLVVGCKPSENQPVITEPASGFSENSVGAETGTDHPSGSDQDPESGGDPLVLAQQAWDLSPHASTFVVDEKNQNNSCARCHAPTDWMPTLEDIPESCQACKFELAAPPPLIPENEWSGITCLYCHEQDKKGVVQAEVMWLEIPALEEYASVETYTELCLKCHDTTNLPDHGELRLAGDHSGMMCTDCHPPHSSSVSCDSADCHPSDQAAVTIEGHDDLHQDVSCEACHDSAGWEVGIDQETGSWITFSPWSQEIIIAEGDSIINTGNVGFTSHDISKTVNCGRCHFANNEWGLTTDVESP